MAKAKPANNSAQKPRKPTKESPQSPTATQGERQDDNSPNTSNAPLPVGENQGEVDSEELANQRLGTPQTEKTGQGTKAGDVAFSSSEVDLLDSAGQPVILVALARDGEGRAACWERLRKEARAAGMARGQGPGTAYEWATREVERLFPPKPPPPEPEPTVEANPPEPEPEPEISLIGENPETIAVSPAPAAADQGVSGLSDLPAAWPELPANASLQVEIAWVTSNRLRVRSGTGVDLSKALSPAPSYSALSWLETSILFPSKFADISVKATAQQDDEKEHIRREKMSIEEIRGILKEMLED